MVHTVWVNPETRRPAIPYHVQVFTVIKYKHISLSIIITKSIWECGKKFNFSNTESNLRYFIFLTKVKTIASIVDIVNMYILSLVTVDGNWSPWSPWTDCSVTCGTGSTSRVRSCDDPEPKFNGKHCVGEGDEEERCYPQPCPGKFHSRTFCRTFGIWNECLIYVQIYVLRIEIKVHTSN